MHVDGADGHDLLTVPGSQVSDQHRDQCVQLVDLSRETEKEIDMELAILSFALNFLKE